MKVYYMKKILSLMFVFSFFCSKATFMDKVKAIQGKAQTIGLNALNAAKENKKRAFLITLQVAVIASQIYRVGKPNINLNIFVEDKSNLLSTGEHSLLGKYILSMYKKVVGNPTTIENKGLRPLTYFQHLFHNGTAGTLVILELLKKLVPTAE